MAEIQNVSKYFLINFLKPHWSFHLYEGSNTFYEGRPQYRTTITQGKERAQWVDMEISLRCTAKWEN